ncbi:hypothetical protein DFQ28_007611 [Apophysomyces sp. BC1034]|nr:hypothetical protein DFQ30_007452 [Apophysomyces sp. BC1015]KAG0176178.1 hypothetical protein DFQ29_006439 [Apophysomyces sp. BC1021]KAG0186562.1 hypothetical protein DFQ28_007611 [Apophysomyces sp. BC1034]
MAPPDPIAPHSGPISAYMSAHAGCPPGLSTHKLTPSLATNLAYVRYFANKDNATSATFRSLKATGFTVAYTLPDGTNDEAFIEFKTPLVKREEVRPVLEAMAKEAETALGLPSSLGGPPPMAAIAKAIYAQTTSVYIPPNPSVPLDLFYAPPKKWQVFVGLALGATALVAYLPERRFPQELLRYRELIGVDLACKVFRTTATIHAVEAAVTYLICLRRGWYSPLTILKWTASTFLFGGGSIMQLTRHSRQVQGIQ